jgi:hypothetical protein
VYMFLFISGMAVSCGLSAISFRNFGLMNNTDYD